MDVTTEPLIDAHIDDAMHFLRLANPFAQHTWGWETGRLVDWRWGGNILRDRTEPGFFGRNGTVVKRNDRIVALVIAERGGEDHCILTATDDSDLLGGVLVGYSRNAAGSRRSSLRPMRHRGYMTFSSLTTSRKVRWRRWHGATT